MTPTISYPTKSRSFAKQLPLNHHSNDFTSAAGIRVSLPLYIDPPTVVRKQLFNAVREACNGAATATPAINSRSGISVETSDSRMAAVESYLGLTVENLRNVIFSRGGISCDLILKIQEVSDHEVISMKEIETAFKQRIAQIKKFTKDYPYGETTQEV